MDDRLRGLERAARAAADPAAAWAYAHALEQAGDVVGAWRERCRLARAGDARARDELAALPEGARSIGSIARREVRGGPLQVSASGRALALGHRDELLVLDAGDLSTRWTRRGGAFARAHGPLVVHVDEREVLVREAARGEALGRAPLRAGLLPLRVDALGAHAAVSCRREDGTACVVVVDLADRPGAVVAVHEGARVFSVVTGRLVVRGADGSVEARDVVTNAVLESFTERVRAGQFIGDPPPPALARRVAGDDALEARARDVVYVASSPEDGRVRATSTVLALDAATEAVLWTRDVAHPHAVDVDVPRTRLRLLAVPGAALLVAVGSDRTHVLRLAP